MGRAKRIHRVAIADNRVLYRRGLKTLLAAEEDIEVLAEVSSTTEMTNLAARLLPDVFIVNVELLQDLSDQALLSVRQMQTATPTLFLSPADEEQYLELATKSGARAYMLKSVEPGLLIDAVRRLATSDDGSAEAPQAAADLKALADSSERWSNAAALTPREMEILRFLAEGLTVRQTAAELTLSVKTIEAHKLNLMRKLDIHDRATLIQYAAKKGIVAVPTAA